MYVSLTVSGKDTSIYYVIKYTTIFRPPTHPYPVVNLNFKLKTSRIFGPKLSTLLCHDVIYVRPLDSSVPDTMHVTVTYVQYKLCETKGIKIIREKYYSPVTN